MSRQEDVAIGKLIFMFVGLVIIFICVLVIWLVPQGGYPEIIDINGIRFWREEYEADNPLAKHYEFTPPTITKYRYYLISPEPVNLKEFQERYFSDMLNQLSRKPKNE